MTATIQVAAVTSPDQWALGVGANKVVAVNEPNDDDASYIATNISSYYETYSLGANTIPAGSTINSVSIISRCKKTASSGSYTVWLYLGVNHSLSSAHVFGSSYSDNVDVMSRPGGGSWLYADIAGITIAIQHGSGSAVARCTTFCLSVDYTPPTSSAFLMLL